MTESKRTAGQPLQALSLILGSVEAVRNGRALYLMVGTFALGGLLLAMAESSLAKDARWWATLHGGLALFVAFYGANAAGLVLMDEARGQRQREVEEAVRDSLLQSHRLLLVLLGVLCVLAVLLGTLAAALWASRGDVLGAWAGPLLFGAALPSAVIALGLGLLAMAGVVVPLSAAGLWMGLDLRQTLIFCRHQLRRRLLAVAMLTTAVAMLTSAVAGLIAFAVFSSGRLVAVMAVLITGIEVPPQQLMAGFFGYGLRSLGAAGAPLAQNGHAFAALVGGGAVFVLALVLPALVYLRGLCAIFLLLRQADLDAEVPPTH